MTKKVLALLLSVLMLIGMFPMSAAAATDATTRVKGLKPDGGLDAVSVSATVEGTAHTVTLSGHVKTTRKEGNGDAACWAGVGILPPAGYEKNTKVSYALSDGGASASFVLNNTDGTLDDIQDSQKGFYIWIDVDNQTSGDVDLSLKWEADEQSAATETFNFVWTALTYCLCTLECKCENSTCECTKCECADCKGKEEEDEISYVAITPADRVVKLANALGVVGVQTSSLSFDAASSVNTVAITARAKPSISAEEKAQNLPWFGVGIIAPEGMTKLETYTGNAKAADGQVTYNKYTADDPSLALDWMQAEGKYGYGLWLDATDEEETDGFVKTLKWTNDDGSQTVYEIVKFTWTATAEQTTIALDEVGFAADAAAAESGIKAAVAKVNKNFTLPANDVAPNTMWATFSLDGTPDGDLKITFKNGSNEYVETIEAAKVSKNSTGGVAYVSFDDQAKTNFPSGSIGGEYTISATINGRAAAATKTLKIYEVIKNYNDEGATPNATELSTGETAPTKPAETPTREGYTFKGWGDGEKSNNDYTITFTAEWEEDNEDGCQCPGCVEGDEECTCDGNCSDGECECPNCNPEEPMPDHEHNWGSVVWAADWTETEDGGWTITATQSCTVTDEEHTENLTVNVEVVTVNPDCTTPGTITYSATATLMDGTTETYSSDKVVNLDATGHTWGEEIEWDWSDVENGNATATRTCEVCSATESKTDNAVASEVTDPTCTEAGYTTYTATVTFDGDEEPTIGETVAEGAPATGHEFEKNEDGTKLVCKNGCGTELDFEASEDGDTETAVLVDSGIQDITDDLAATSFNTAEAIEAELQTKVDAQSGYSSENIAIYDVQLLINNETTTGWEVADADAVKEYGTVTAFLPYPEAIDDYTKYDFVVLHMISHGDNAGYVEVVTDVSADSTGLTIKLTSLSPVAVSWKEKAAEQPKPPVSGGDDDEEEPGTEKPAYNNCPKDSTCPIAQFKDTATTGWYHDAVHFVLDNGLMSGNGDGTFTPDSTLTRAMLVQILYNLEGKPADVGPVSFSDVDATVWYADAVRWAASHGIVAGNGDGTFSPEAAITREQVAVIFRNYAKNYLGKNVGIAERTDISKYTDAGKASRWAVDALKWAVGTGLISGTTSTTLEPAATATRAQAASILMKYCENLA